MELRIKILDFNEIRMLSFFLFINNINIVFVLNLLKRFFRKQITHCRFYNDGNYYYIHVIINARFISFWNIFVTINIYVNLYLQRIVRINAMCNSSKLDNSSNLTKPRSKEVTRLWETSFIFKRSCY